VTVGLIVALALAVLIGVSLGTLGSGGSIITVPVLVYVARIPTHTAVGMSLVIVGATAAVGSYLQRGGQILGPAFPRPDVRAAEDTPGAEPDLAGIDIRAAVIFAATGMAGAFVGARLTHLVSGDVLMRIFAVLMLLAGWRMLARNGLSAGMRACNVPRCAGVGVVLGVLTGFLGVGGGFLIVPALVLFAGLDMKRAVPTSLAIIAFNSLGGLVGQLRYVDFNWALTAAFLGSALAGMFGGTTVARRLSADHIRRGFAWVIILLGAAILGGQILGGAGPV
jgi:hypothetical protein